MIGRWRLLIKPQQRRLMIEISTPTTTFTIFNDNLSMAYPLNKSYMENLSKEDQIFFCSLKDKLDLLKKEPDPVIVENILNYSKSL